LVDWPKRRAMALRLNHPRGQSSPAHLCRRQHAAPALMKPAERGGVLVSLGIQNARGRQITRSRTVIECARLVGSGCRQHPWSEEFRQVTLVIRGGCSCTVSMSTQMGRPAPSVVGESAVGLFDATLVVRRCSSPARRPSGPHASFLAAGTKVTYSRCEFGLAPSRMPPPAR
jgi:hypothetical protein